MLVGHLSSKGDRLGFFALAFTVAVAGSREGEIPVYTDKGTGAQWRVSRWELERLHLYLKITADPFRAGPDGPGIFIEDPRVLENMARRGADPGFRLLEADSVCVSVLRLMSSAPGAASAWPAAGPGDPAARAGILDAAVEAVVSGGDGLECRKYRRERYPAGDDVGFRPSRESARSMLLELVRLARREGPFGPGERLVLEGLARHFAVEPGALERMEAIAVEEDRVMSLAVELVAAGGPGRQGPEGGPSAASPPRLRGA